MMIFVLLRPAKSSLATRNEPRFALMAMELAVMGLAALDFVLLEVAAMESAI